MGLLAKRKHNIYELESAQMTLFNLPQMRQTTDYLYKQVAEMARTLEPLVHKQVLPISVKDELIGIREAARMLNVCVKTVSRYATDGMLASTRISKRKVLFRKHDILEMLNRNYRPVRDYDE